MQILLSIPFIIAILLILFVLVLLGHNLFLLHKYNKNSEEKLLLRSTLLLQLVVVISFIVDKYWHFSIHRPDIYVYVSSISSVASDYLFSLVHIVIGTMFNIYVKAIQVDLEGFAALVSKPVNRL